MQGKGVSFAVTGDSFITRNHPAARLGGAAGAEAGSVKRFREIAAMIGQAEVRFTNLEVTIHDYEGYPSAAAGGTYAAAYPSVLGSLKGYGFNLVSTANNHAFDYTFDGLLATLRNLDQNGFVHAGAGRNLAEAAAPRYIDTPSGRTALVSACSTLDPASVAGDQRRDSGGRPGINPLRMEATHIVTPETLELLKRTACETNINAYHDLMVKEGFYTSPADGAWLFGSSRFIAGEDPGRRTAANPGDLARIASSVREAARQADHVLVSIHSHEMESDRKDLPARFLVDAAHELIDQGASAIICHGPHLLRGIEMYRGRPIFYSLGNFVFQSETVARLPADFYAKYGLGPHDNVADALDARTDGDRKGLGANQAVWETVIPSWSFRGDRLEEMVVYPVSLGYGQPRYRRGWPERSTDTGILQRLAALSAPFGTEIEIDGKACVGRIRAAAG